MMDFNWKKASIWGSITLLALITLFSSIYIVSPGYRGVLVTLGNVSEKSYVNGLGFKPPFVSSMKKIDVRTVEMTQKAVSYTQDVQTAEVEYTFTYNLKPDNVWDLYQKVGQDYESKKVTPVLNDVIKDIIGHWQAQDLVGNRDKARLEILSALNERLDASYFENYTFQFINIDYSDNFENAIEAKVIAEQKAQEAVNNTRRIKEEAEQKVITAQAEAKAMAIKSKALESNKNLIQYEATLRWDGKLPTYMMGDAVPFIGLK
jgi:regulator of protease activity HflC (stomatin/prohibitin superfamily)